MRDTILFTIDVEDWFQVENFKPYIPYASWSELELRVDRNIRRLLDLLDSKQTLHTIETREPCRLKATFFVLGWIAERVPGIVRAISARGHEVASHGFNHELCTRLTPAELKKDLSDSKRLLEDLTGEAVIGFRAPNFSVNNRILEVIESCGYLYDASYNSFEMNSRYGKVDLTYAKRNGFAYSLSDHFKELPLSNLTVGNHTIPFGGGGYFRLYPFCILKAGAEYILKKEKVYHFYIHPWEIDAEQPTVQQASFLPRFRHYHNLRSNFQKLEKFMDAFQNCNFLSCRNYLGL